MDKAKVIYKALKEGVIDFSGAHAIHTPQGLVEEILSHLPLQGSILVLFNIEFVISLIYTYKVDPSSITFYSDHKNKSYFCKKLGVKYIESLETDMKFDVVVGNPPYQDKTNSNLYKKFISKAKEISNLVALIVPSSNFKDIDEFQNLKKYSFKGNCFSNVQVLVSWFVWENNFSDRTEIIDSHGKVIKVNKILVAPTDNLNRFQLVNRILEKNYSGWEVKNGKLSRNRAILDNNGIWCIWSCGRKDQEFDKVKISHLLVDAISGIGQHKVVFSGDYTTTSIGPVKYAAPDHGCAMKAHYISVESEAEAQNLINYLNSKFVKYIVADIKGTSTKNGKTVFRKIPKVDLTRTWTDQELYAHFGLTQEEIDYVEANVK
ncbi:MAG: Eco57I restriction-modification methylase domain-containing protein [Fischerella sp.]|nr:Eco57I restriction-modification methylase domain-containing protein [Fischerella sp.]